MSTLRQRRISILAAILVLSGCTSVPPQVIQVQLQEKAIIESLRTSHLALADVYMETKFEQFEKFFFSKYGPHFRDEWEKKFLQKKGRPYNSEGDFPHFYNDLVAEYQDKSKRIARLHSKLRQSIDIEYQNALRAHSAVNQWLVALEDLNETQRNIVNSILDSIRPKLSLDVIESTIHEIEIDVTLPQNTE